MANPAVGLLEFSSIARGIVSGDAMVKRAPVASAYAGTVHPGKYLVLVAGDTASVEEAMAAGREVGAGMVLDAVFLADIHPDVVTAMLNEDPTRPESGEALGVVETSTTSAVIDAADAGVKAADVAVGQLRLSDGLGGKGYVLFSGVVADVEAAVDAAVVRAGSQLVESAVIASLHEEIADNLWTAARFLERIHTHEVGA
ncbi:MAG: BMC domain-containing protein [Acidimicrobiia bacterium]|nr:BMC domain-containing protein [Acidimicrobiia bacterium]